MAEASTLHVFIRHFSNEFIPLLERKAATHADMLQCSRLVIQPQQQRSDRRLISLAIPAEPSDDAVAVALMVYFKHRSLVGLISAVLRFRHDAIEASSLETLEPVTRQCRIICGRRDMKR